MMIVVTDVDFGGRDVTATIKAEMMQDLECTPKHVNRINTNCVVNTRQSCNIVCEPTALSKLPSCQCCQDIAAGVISLIFGKLQTSASALSASLSLATSARLYLGHPNAECKNYVHGYFIICSCYWMFFILVMMALTKDSRRLS